MHYTGYEKIDIGSLGEMGNIYADHVLLFDDLYSFLSWYNSERIHHRASREWIKRYYGDEYKEYIHSSFPHVKGKVSLLKRYINAIDNYFLEPTDEELRIQWEKSKNNFKEAKLDWLIDTFEEYKRLKLEGYHKPMKIEGVLVEGYYDDTNTPKGLKRRVYEILNKTDKKYFAICENVVTMK